MMKAEAALERYENVNRDWLGSRLRELEEAEENIAETRQGLERFRQYDERHPGGFGHLMSQWEYFLSEYEENRDRLMELLADYHKLQAGLAVAEDELRQAQVRLGELEQGPDVLQLRDLEAAVRLAESELEQAKSTVAELQQGVDPLLAHLRHRQVGAAKAGWEQSLADLEEMLAGGDPLEVELRRKQVELAETTLEQARYELSLPGLSNRRTDREQELALREAEIVLARQDVMDARRLLDEAVIRSPLDGVAGVVHIEAGDRVKAEDAIVEVIDTGIVEIDGVVDEIDVLSISPGTPAEVIFDALRDEVFTGTVTQVASAGANQQGVVTYAITTRVDLPEGVQLREGLTAVANMVLNQERGVLLVPQQALYGTFEQSTVRVLTELGIEERPVRLGSSDDFWVAVNDGLEEGETIVMEGAEVSTTGSGFRQLRTISGGGRRRR
jgi:RND family efflux transporter MFP subunit